MTGGPEPGGPALGSDRKAPRILAERARLLARPAVEPAGSTFALITFTLGGERWGLEARLVWEVFRISELARLPGSEATVAGITPWRGAILPVLDLRPVLGTSTAALDDLRFAVVVGAERPAIGLLADAVDEVRFVDESELGAAPEGVTLHRDHLLGVTTEALPVLDGARLVERYG